MDSQARYDASLAAIPVVFALGGTLTTVANGTLGSLAAIGTVLVGVGTVGQALFVSPPTEATD